MAAMEPFSLCLCPSTRFSAALRQVPRLLFAGDEHPQGSHIDPHAYLLLKQKATHYVFVSHLDRNCNALGASIYGSLPAVYPSQRKAPHSQMKHIFKIASILVAISAIWIALLESSTVPRSYTWLLPIYLVVALGCYGLFMVGFGLMFFPTCPQEAVLFLRNLKKLYYCNRILWRQSNS